MSFFTQEQQDMLDARLDPANVKTRKGRDGKMVSYVEGWYPTDLANQIFGHGNWDCVSEVKREHEPVLVKPEKGNPFVVVTYSAKVTITVWNLDHTKCCVRQRHGGHRGFAPTTGEAIEDTMKSAETDATKRAWTTFGHVFGLALYDKSGKHVGRDEPRQLVQGQSRAAIDVGFETVPTESDRGFAARTREREPEPAPPRPTNAQRALATLEPRPTPNGHADNGHWPPTNGGLRY